MSSWMSLTPLWEKSGVWMSWFLCVQQKDSLNRKRPERAHLSIIAPNKRGNITTLKNFKFQESNNQSPFSLLNI